MINGIINVYKEKGYTSFDVVAKMRGIFRQKKIGHTGTLDPDAEGVLPVCLGKATKVCGLLTDKDKEYEAVLLLGVETDTQDIGGTVLRTAEVRAGEEEVQKAIASFAGQYEQVPPMYSALKVQGKRLYELARQGVTVEREARSVQIHEIEVLGIRLPEVQIRVRCSKGTYIRTLCRDIGARLGCGGCMKSLLRTRVAEFTLEQAHRLSEIEAMDPAEREGVLFPVDSVFSHLPKAFARKEADRLLANGNRIPQQMIVGLQPELCSGQIRIYNDNGDFIGLYAYQPEAEDFQPVKIFIEP